MEQTVHLEEELRKANAARVQLDTYKRQVWSGYNLFRVHEQFLLDYWLYSCNMNS